ncbi:MAG: rod shape-determining protein MreD [Candidatus Omnitrophica bacterium]|nr:rod shape-determining protein MreD [Candidatus Omnitrophota bacterium]
MYRRNQIWLYISIILIGCFELLFKQRFSIAGVFPDLMMIFVVFFGLFYGPKQGLQTGLFAGFIIDLLGEHFLGINIFYYMSAGVVCGFLGDKIYKESPFTQIISVFFLTMLISKMNIPHCLYTALISPFVFFILEQIFFQREEVF